MKKVYFIFLILLVLLLQCNYGNFSYSRGPVIEEIIVSNRTPAFNETIKISVKAFDPNGDALTYKWTCSEGSLDVDNKDSINWISPGNPKSSTISVLVSDGEPGHFITESIVLTPSEPVAGNSGSNSLPLFGDSYVFGKLVFEEDPNNLTDEDTLQMVATSDGGYIMAGCSKQTGSSNYDILVIKISSDNKIQWQKYYGGTYDDEVTSILETSDKGFLVTGNSNSFRGNNPDLLVMKLDSTGNIQWQKVFGGNNLDFGGTACETEFGDFLLFGTTYSYGQGIGIRSEFLVIKLSKEGVLNWAFAYGTTEFDAPLDIIPAPGGGFFICGNTYIVDTSLDAWILKFDVNGGFLWGKAISGYSDASDEELLKMSSTSDKGVILTGYTHSDAGVGKQDAWLVKLLSNGSVAWQCSYGGAGDDKGFSVKEIPGGEFLLAGKTETSFAGESDGWLLNLKGDGTILWQKRYGLGNDDKLYFIDRKSDGRLIAGGVTGIPGSGEKSCLLLVLSDAGICQVDSLYTFVARRETTGPVSNLAGLQTIISVLPSAVTNIVPVNANFAMEKFFK